MVAVYEENREEKAGRDGLEITRTFRVEPATERGLVLDVLLGGVRLVGGRLFRVAPARDPWYPWCYCVDVKTTPFEVLNSPGTNVGLAQLLTRNYSESVRMVATYKTLDREDRDTDGGSDENDEKELASESYDFSSTQMLMPGQYWKWPSDSKLLVNTDTTVTRPIALLSYSLVRHFCINIPIEAIKALQNCVNKRAFLVKKKNNNAQCVRLEGAHISHKTTNQGIQFAEIDYRFAVRHFKDYTSDGGTTPQTITWNHIYRGEKAWWEKPATNANDRTVYLLDDDVISQTIGGRTVSGFDLLFHPGAS